MIIPQTGRARGQRRGEAAASEMTNGPMARLMIAIMSFPQVLIRPTAGHCRNM
jgi:hypothetical protein